MDLPTELRQIMQRSIDVAQDLQAQINRLNGMPELDNTSLTLLIQAHTAHLLNHCAIIKTVTVAVKGDLGLPLQSIINAGEQMTKDTRQLQEYLIVSSAPSPQNDAASLADDIEGLRVKSDRGAAKPTTPAPSTRNYEAPTVEASEDEDDHNKSATQEKKVHTPHPDANANGIGPEHAQSQTSPEVPAAAGPETAKSTPKRQREDDDEHPSLVLKRMRRSPVPTITNAERKRKSDVSMVDANDSEESSSQPSSSKRQKQEQDRNGNAKEAPTTTAVPVEEYEDINAEVEARMLRTAMRREAEKRKKLGIVDKRKRMSNDSFEVELSRQDDRDVEKPKRKRKKFEA